VDPRTVSKPEFVQSHHNLVNGVDIFNSVACADMFCDTRSGFTVAYELGGLANPSLLGAFWPSSNQVNQAGK
jgi:hypothetical protein